MSIANFLQRLDQRRPLIGVVGDSMIDRYVPVIVDRLSPEFPNPITRRDHSKYIVELPGGAANVAYQFRNFNVDARLITAYDDQANKVYSKAGLEFESLSYGFSYDRFEQSAGFNPVKTRYYVDDFPYGRHDDEMPFETWEHLGVDDYVLHLDKFTGWPNFDALIISDYHKGFFHLANHPNLWIERAPITVVDPKKCPICRWKGCSVFKPNAVEAEAISGRKKWQDQADYFLKAVKCQHVVITQGGSGVVGKSADGSSFEYRPTTSVNPRSVIGAGDCFIAFLTMALTLEMPLNESAEVAFKAGMIYVKNIHNKPITPHDLICHEDPIAAKSLIPLKPRDYKKLVFTNGCFDILHAGHLETLRFAKSKGDRLVVALNSDESVKRLKGSSRPINLLADRMALVAGLECVDFVCSFNEDTPAEIIQRINPEVIVKGGDYTPETIVGARGREVFVAPLLSGRSSTAIINSGPSLFTIP